MYLERWTSRDVSRVCKKLATFFVSILFSFYFYLSDKFHLVLFVADSQVICHANIGILIATSFSILNQNRRINLIGLSWKLSRPWTWGENQKRGLFFNFRFAVAFKRNPTCNRACYKYRNLYKLAFSPWRKNRKTTLQSYYCRINYRVIN